MEPLVGVPITPGWGKLFMDNANRGANAENDDLIHELTERIRALADPHNQQ
jgi:hypothetical protein